MKKKLNKKNNLFCLSSDDALPANYSILTERLKPLYNVLKEFSLDFNSGNFKIADAISSGRNEGRKNTTISFPELQKNTLLPTTVFLQKEDSFSVLKEFSFDFNSGNIKIAGDFSIGRNEGRKKNHNNIFSEVKNITLLPTTYRKAKAFMYRQSKNSDS